MHGTTACSVPSCCSADLDDEDLEFKAVSLSTALQGWQGWQGGAATRGPAQARAAKGTGGGSGSGSGGRDGPKGYEVRGHRREGAACMVQGCVYPAAVDT